MPLPASDAVAAPFFSVNAQTKSCRRLAPSKSAAARAFDAFLPAVPPVPRMLSSAQSYVILYSEAAAFAASGRCRPVVYIEMLQARAHLRWDRLLAFFQACRLYVRPSAN